MGAEATRGPSWRSMIMVGVLLVVSTLIVHRGHSREFLNYDDDVYVVENPIVRYGLSADALERAFTAPHAANYHPPHLGLAHARRRAVRPGLVEASAHLDRAPRTERVPALARAMRSHPRARAQRVRGAQRIGTDRVAYLTCGRTSASCHRGHLVAVVRRRKAPEWRVRSTGVEVDQMVARTVDASVSIRRLRRGVRWVHRRRIDVNIGSDCKRERALRRHVEQQKQHQQRTLA